MADPDLLAAPLAEIAPLLRAATDPAYRRGGRVKARQPSHVEC
jgi:hypothetical protein